jgi:putative ABC transport system permease protein
MLMAVLLIIAITYVRLVIGKGIMARVRGMV